MDASRIVRRIYDNLSWSAAFNAPSTPSAGEVWRRLEALWREPDRTFAALLYPLLLARPADAEGVAALRAALARGAPRSAVVRRLALSGEARASGLDVSWLPHLASLEPEVVWPRLHALWRASDRVFVEGLYQILLGRSSDAGAAGFRALLAAGTPRSEIVRGVALSDEAQATGLDVSWLARLDDLQPRRRRFSFRALNSLFRRWLGGWRVVRPQPAPDQIRPQPASDQIRRAA